MSEKLLCEWQHDGKILVLTLNAPKANILDSDMMSAIDTALTEAAGRDELALIMWRAAGPHFCFGASVAEHQKELAPQMLHQFHGIFRRLVDLEVPTLAEVRGSCLGGGMELVLFCHFVIASETARFGQPEINLGVFPPPASVILPMRVGQAVADDLVLTGRIVNAAGAKDLGLVNHVVPEADDLTAFTDAWIADTILKKSASSLRIANRAARLSFHQMFLNGLDAVERLYIDELMETHDANEGINSFIEKRKPVWQHR